MYKLCVVIRERDNFKCVNCGKLETDRAHDIHHKTPYRLTQDNSETNLITLCVSCHRKLTATERKIYGKTAVSLFSRS